MQLLRNPGRANNRNNKEKQSWIQNAFGLRGGEFSKLLNYLDEELISKPILPQCLTLICI